MPAMKVKKKIEGLDCAAIARKVGVTRQYAWVVFTGQRFPSFEMLRRFAGRLGVTVGELADYLDSLASERSAAA